LRDKLAVQILFDELARRFEARQGGYTRIVRITSRRLGDAGPQALIEFVGVHDRVKQRKARPAPVAAPPKAQVPAAESAAPPAAEPPPATP
jgi:large subunit ribosomal protein L17